jgi:STE24 endopeptidase
MVLAVVTVVGVLLSPVLNVVSRRVEARADVHSLELTHDPAAFVESERSLNVRNLSDLDPNALVYAMFATHPRGPERIALARSWARRHGLPEPPGLASAGASVP